jgi:hypothetical protein
MLLWNPQTLTFKFEVPEMPATTGVQKILGFSRGYHHWNSIRLGIRKENDYCVLYLYAYVRGELFIERLGKVAIGEKIKAIISLKRNYYSVNIFSFGQLVYSLTDSFHGKLFFPIGYLLTSYFETDAPENKVMAFDVRIWNIQVNGKNIKL